MSIAFPLVCCMCAFFAFHLHSVVLSHALTLWVRRCSCKMNKKYTKYARTGELIENIYLSCARGQEEEGEEEDTC